MTPSQGHPQVDAYLRTVGRWRAELEMLRAIVLDSGLTEEFKWRQPCYTLQQKNVVILGDFKEYCAVGFFQGALLQDAAGVLHRPGGNTRAARMLRFPGVGEVAEREPLLRTYLREAIDVERAGLKVDFARDRELEVPEELRRRFAELPGLEAAFAALTPGRRRAYVLHVSGAKQASTRASRVDRCVPRILAGKGLHDR